MPVRDSARGPREPPTRPPDPLPTARTHTASCRPRQKSPDRGGPQSRCRSRPCDGVHRTGSRTASRPSSERTKWHKNLIAQLSRRVWRRDLPLPPATGPQREVGGQRRSPERQQWIQNSRPPRRETLVHHLVGSPRRSGGGHYLPLLAVITHLHGVRAHVTHKLTRALDMTSSSAPAFELALRKTRPDLP